MHLVGGNMSASATDRLAINASRLEQLDDSANRRPAIGALMDGWNLEGRIDGSTDDRMH